ncbi:sporulation protein [Sphingomonas sp. Leaf33]|nr:sporulation protein [Sphingomonas sp. Leaf33]
MAKKRFGMAMMFGTAAAVATAALMTAPAAADVKAGVDAWARGDYRKAIDEWRPLAVAGDADAQFNLGQAYKLGRGVPIDLAMAQEWYRKAAVQGHPQASDNYGLALFQNNRREEALPWLEKSAARGEPRAQYVLGTMYFNADVVQRDWVKAYALMTRANAAGLPQAAETLAQMDRYITGGDRQKGTELARRYETEASRPLPSTGTPPVATATRPTRTPPPRRPIETTDVPLSVTPEVIDTRPARPAPRPVAERPIPEPKPAAGGAWRVQLGAFRDPDGARRLWSQLSGRFPGRQPYYVKAGALTRLLVGPYASQAEAARGCGSVKPCVPSR